MLLAVQVGNTHTHLGVFGDDGRDVPRDSWRISTDPARTADELTVVVRSLLRGAGLYEDDLSGVALASGVPSMTTAVRALCESHLELEPVVVGPGVRTGMPIKYDNPRELGADRIANGIGAFHTYGGPCVVVGFGTATTFDVVSERGEYLGGAIVPGIEVSLDGLFHRAAGIRHVELVPPRSVIGTSTVEAIQSGVILGCAELVDGMVRRIHTEAGAGAVVATGSLAALIAPHADNVTTVDPWVTLLGLKLIWEKNQ